MYLFGIVGILVVMDIVFLIPVTVVLSSRLRTEYEEIEGDEVSTLIVILPTMINVTVINDRIVICLR